MTRTFAASRFRHPELVSGSMVRLTLSHRGQTQPDRKVDPMRVLIVDQIDFPGAAPILELLLPRNGSLHRTKHLKMYQIIYGVFGRMSGRQTVTMLRQAFEQIRRDANIERAIMLACKYVYAGGFFISHALESAAKWTLKQVQGDVNFGKMFHMNSNLHAVTLNVFQDPSRNGKARFA